MKSGYYKSTIVILFFCFFVLNLYGQDGNLQNQISVQKNQVNINKDGNVLVDMNILLNGVEVSSKRQLVLTPIIKGANNRVELPPVVVNGKGRANLYKRSLALSGKPDRSAAVVKANNKIFTTTIPYKATTPYESWMKDASVYLTGDLCGCGGAKEDYANNLIAKGIDYAEFKGNFAPSVTFLIPQKEEVKKRDESGEAYVIFQTDKWDILPQLSNNSRELAKIRSSLQYVREEPTTNINAVSIKAYASPEAPYDYNMNLSRNRANALADYVRNHDDVPSGMMNYQGMGEDWATFEKMVSADPNISYRSDILRIIRNNSSPDEKEQQLRNLAGGAPFNYVLNNIFPRLRRADYRIEYTVPPYSIEKGKELIKSNKSNMLSLEEMYQIAYSYDEGSKAFNDVFLQAVKAFPNDKIAQVNAATANILAGNFQDAQAILEQYQNDPDAWNSLGLVYMYRNNFQQAQYYLERARDRGVTAAQENLRSLDKVKEQYKTYLREKAAFEYR